MIDGMAFPTLEVGFAWSDPEAAIADAKAHIDRFKPRFATDRYERPATQLAGQISYPSRTDRAGDAAVSNCPDCSALALGPAASSPAAPVPEYWTMRCTRCGGVHLDIINPSTAPLTA